MYCDYGHETAESRKLPIGGNANLFLCHKHYLAELEAREAEDPRGRPAWDSLVTQDEAYS